MTEGTFSEVKGTCFVVMGFGLEGILNKSLGAIAAVVLIVGADGGFKEMLIATKSAISLDSGPPRHTSRHSYWAGRPQPW